MIEPRFRAFADGYISLEEFLDLSTEIYQSTTSMDYLITKGDTTLRICHDSKVRWNIYDTAFTKRLIGQA